MVKKTIKFDIYIKTSEQTPTYSYTAKQKVMSNDKDSTQITFNLLDVAPEELSGSSASILLYMEDGSFFQKSDVTINRNSVIYTMKPEETRHSGNTKVQIVLNKGTVQTASLIYHFEIERGLEKFPIVEKEIQDWTTLTAEAKAFVEQIKDFTLEGFVENKMGEELANLETNYATRLTGLERKDTEITAQLDQTVKKGETGALNLDIFDEPTRNILQGQEPGTINAVLGEGNVLPFNTSFFQRGTNLYNPATTKEGVYYGWSTGNEIPAENFLGSGLIPVEPNEQYFIRTARYIVFANSDGSYVSGVNDTSAKNEYVVTIPSGVRRMRVSWKGTDNPLPQQVNKGDKALPYEPYRVYIPKELTEAHDIQPEDIPDIDIANLSFSKMKSNLFDKSKAQINKTISNSTGGASTATRFVAYENMPVEAGKSYIIKSVRAYAWKDSKGLFVSGSPDISPKTNAVVTAPANATMLSFSWYPPSDTTTIDDQQVNEGTELLPYEDFGYYIPNDFLEKRTGNSGSEVKLALSLPPEIFAVTGKEVNIYFDNISSLLLDNFQVDVTCSLGKQFSDRWTATPTIAGNHPITVAVYKDFEMVAQANSVVRVKDADAGSGVTRNALVIGDSTIAQDYLINHLEDTFTTDAMTVNFKGTRGTYGETHNEGYAGWTVSDLRTSKQYQSVVHPFYNAQKGDFDFAYYISNQGYSNLNHVILCFGINDTFSYTSDEALLNNVPNTLADFDYIVNDIKSYDSNIKIGVCVTIPPNASQDAFGEAYSTGQTQWRYKRNNALWTEKLISHFKGKTSERIFLVPDNVNIDAETGFRDGVHPNQEVGDKQRADTFYSWFKSFEV